MHFDISIIICLHNGSKRIIPTLKAIAVQNISRDLRCELLIVDNASTDSSADIASAFWNSTKSSIPLRIIKEPKPGKANALVTGYNAAKCELMLLCDDDNWLQPDYIMTVAEIYSKHPDIGLLGGYGRAFFEPGQKPAWFDSYEKAYVCGKLHKKNGYLKPLDYRIWGAGSVLRKKMWEFIRSNGFSFHLSTKGGKAMGEDVELAMAITFTGHCLYFDDRLWFIHDLNSGRISWYNFLLQQSLAGKSQATLTIYRIAYYKNSYKVLFSLLLAIEVLLIIIGFLSQVVRWNIPGMKLHLSALQELISNIRKYAKLSKEASVWTARISGTFPLSS